MNGKTHFAFLILVILQGFHSIEEYIGKLWESFPPATFLCGLISDDLERGFLIINIGLFIIGMLFWLFIVRKNRSFSLIILWIWIGIELVNGVGHPIWSVMENSYTPGLITAPLLFIAAIHAIRTLFQKSTHV